MRYVWQCTLFAVSGAALACITESSGTPAAGVRDTLADGTVVVRYERSFAPRAPALAPDLSIGVMEGDLNYVFGDVRGIEADSAGTIYVLDYQAAEVRAYDAEGRYLHTLTRKGRGPGELTEANGMILIGDSALWIQDHAQRMMIAVDLRGEELTRVPMHVRSYGYMWNGTIDHQGRFWKPTSHSNEPRVYPPPEGLNESRSRRYLKSYDPRTDVTDSVYVGDVVYRSVVSSNNRGTTYYSIPNDPSTITVVDAAGGFWQTSGTDYRIARLDERGDTTLVIEVPAEPVPVTGQDRQDYVDRIVERSPGERRAAEEVAGLMPEFKPVIAQLILDDLGRLWVRRAPVQGAPTTYDVFNPDGEYAGTVQLGFEPSQYLPIRIRRGRIYALVHDSLDVPSVVRTGVEPVGAW